MYFVSLYLKIIFDKSAKAIQQIMGVSISTNGVGMIGCPYATKRKELQSIPPTYIKIKLYHRPRLWF